jgi:hypothetical protein
MSGLTIRVFGARGEAVGLFLLQFSALAAW